MSVLFKVKKSLHPSVQYRMKKLLSFFESTDRYTVDKRGILNTVTVIVLKCDEKPKKKIFTKKEKPEFESQPDPVLNNVTVIVLKCKKNE